MLRVFCLVWCMRFFVDAAISILPSECPSNTCVCNLDVNITCTSFPYITRAAWNVDGTNVFECVFGVCASYSSDYGFYHDTTTGTFIISINPITIHDHQTEFKCYGEGLETITFQPEVVARLKPPDFNISTAVETDKTHITVLTNCIDNPVNDVSFKLQDNTSTTVKTENVISITSVACSNDDNPDCGGNNTARARATFTISTQATGTQTGIRLISTQNGVGVDDVFIGNYILKAEDLDSSEDSSSWCKDNLNECVSMLVVVSVLSLLIIIAIIVAVVKGNTYILRFEGIPRSIDIADILFETYGFSVIEDIIDKPQPCMFHPWETVNHNIKVSSKKHVLPETIWVNQFKLSLDHQFGRRPFENIYSTVKKMLVKGLPTSMDNETIRLEFKRSGIDVTNIRNQDTIGSDMKLKCTTVDRIVTVTVESLNEHRPEFVDIDQFYLKKEYKSGRKPFEYIFMIAEIRMVVNGLPKRLKKKDIKLPFKTECRQLKDINIQNATTSSVYDESLQCETVDRIITLKNVTFEPLIMLLQIDSFKLEMLYIPRNKPYQYIYSRSDAVVLKDLPTLIGIETIKTTFKRNGLEVKNVYQDTDTEKHYNKPDCSTVDRIVTVPVGLQNEHLPQCIHIGQFELEKRRVQKNTSFEYLYSIKGQTFQVRFEKIPISLDIEEGLQSKGFIVTSKEEVEKHNDPILLCDTVNYSVCVLNTHPLVTTLPNVLTIGQFTLSLRPALKNERFDYAYSITHAEMVMKDFPKSVTNETIISAFKPIDAILTNIQNAQATMGLDKKLNCTTEDRIVTVSVESLCEHRSEFVNVGPFMLKKEFQPGKKPFEYSFVIRDITAIVQDVPKTVTNDTIKSAFKKMKPTGIDVHDATNTARNNERTNSKTTDRTVTVKEPAESLSTLMTIDGFKFELQFVPENKTFKCIYSLTDIMTIQGFPKSINIDYRTIDLKVNNVYYDNDKHDPLLRCKVADCIVTGPVGCLEKRLPQWKDVDYFKLRLSYESGRQPFEYIYTISEIQMVVTCLPISVVSNQIESAFKTNGLPCVVKTKDNENATSCMRNRRSQVYTHVDRIATISVGYLAKPFPQFINVGQFKLERPCDPGRISFEHTYSVTEMTMIFKGIPVSFSIGTMSAVLKTLYLQVVYIDINMNGKRLDDELKCLTYDLDVTVSAKKKGSSICLVDHLPSNFKVSSYDLQQQQEHTLYLNSKSDRFKKAYHSTPSDNTTTSRANKEIKMTIKGVPASVKNESIESAFDRMKHKSIAVCSATRRDRSVTLTEPEEPLPAFMTIDDRFKLEMQYVEEFEFIYSCTEMDTLTFTGVPLSLNIDTFASKIEAEIDKENKQRVLKVTIDYAKHDYGAVDLKAIVSDKCYEPNLKSDLEVDGLIFRQSTVEHTTYKFVKSANKDRTNESETTSM